MLNLAFLRSPAKINNQRKTAHLPNIKLFSDIPQHRSTSSVDPIIFCYRKYQDNEGQCLGSVTIGVSSLKDKVYISNIKVEENQHRKGFGLAILKSLYDEFHLPLVAIKELHSAKPFWNSARELFGELFIVHPEIHEEDIALERERIKTEFLAKKEYSGPESH